MKHLAIAALALLLAGAVGEASATKPAAPSVCWSQAFEGDRFTVCRYTPAEHELRLVWRGPNGPLRSLPALQRHLAADAGRALFAMNVGMYDEAGAPVGLYVENGKVLKTLNRRDGPGNFHLKPNGVFWIGGDGLPHVDSSDAFAAGRVRPRWASQSGPLLMSRRVLHPKIAPDGASKLIRNGVCVKGPLALFVISEGPTSFGRLARFQRDGLGCSDGLYFDGVVSSLWSRQLKRLDRRDDLGPMVVVFARPAGPSP